MCWYRHSVTVLFLGSFLAVGTITSAEPVCDICKDGSFPTKPSTVVAALFVDDGRPRSCRTLFGEGQNGLIPERLCNPIRASELLQKDCGCDGSGSGEVAQNNADPTAVVKPQVLVNGVPREEFEAAQNGNSSPSPPSPSPPSPAPPSPKPPPSSLPLSSVVTPIAVSAPDFNFNVVGDFNPAGLGAGAVNMLSVPQQQPIGITTTNFDFDTSASITAAAGLGAGSATTGLPNLGIVVPTFPAETAGLGGLGTPNAAALGIPGIIPVGNTGLGSIRGSIGSPNSEATDSLGGSSAYTTGLPSFTVDAADFSSNLGIDIPAIVFLPLIP